MSDTTLPPKELAEKIRKYARFGETPGRRETFLAGADRIEQFAELLQFSLHDGDHLCGCQWCEKVRPLVDASVSTKGA
jgi:hypothetical protein